MGPELTQQCLIFILIKIYYVRLIGALYVFSVELNSLHIVFQSILIAFEDIKKKSILTIELYP